MSDLFDNLKKPTPTPKPADKEVFARTLPPDEDVRSKEGIEGAALCSALRAALEPVLAEFGRKVWGKNITVCSPRRFQEDVITPYPAYSIGHYSGLTRVILRKDIHYYVPRVLEVGFAMFVSLNPDVLPRVKRNDVVKYDASALDPLHRYVYVVSLYDVQEPNASIGVWRGVEIPERDSPIQTREEERARIDEILCYKRGQYVEARRLAQISEALQYGRLHVCRGYANLKSPIAGQSVAQIVEQVKAYMVQLFNQ